MTTYCMPTTMLDSKNIKVNQIDAVPIFMQLTQLFEEGGKA